MSSMFSIFDPVSMFNLGLNWASLAVGSILIPSGFWASGGQATYGAKVLFNSVNKEITSVFAPALRPGSTFLLISLFTLILTLNVLSMLPFVFTPTGHLSITMALAFPLWGGYIGISMFKAPEQFFAHLVPSGTPPFLMPFMVIIEMISSVIRPLTLSVRLAANLVAGHLLMTLIGTAVSQNLGVSPHFIGMMAGVALFLMLEIGVAIIQAYVFSLLTSLYLSEARPSEIY